MIRIPIHKIQATAVLAMGVLLLAYLSQAPEPPRAKSAICPQ